jgi:prolyl 4-hydroxylase
MVSVLVASYSPRKTFIPMEPVSSELLSRAKTGDVDAQIALAREFEARGDAQRARAWFAGAAKAGSLPALRMLAMNLLSQEPVVEGDGLGMLRAAAVQGDAEAEHICGMVAAQDGALEQRWPIALQHVQRAAAAGLPLACAALELLASGHAASGDESSRWNTLATLVDAKSFTCAREPTATLSQSPRIFVFERFAAPELCGWLIDRARPRIHRAQVYDPQIGTGGQVRQSRTNSSADFGVVHSDLLLMLLRNRIANSAGLPLQSLESTSILHYAPGEEFSSHYDFLDTSVPGFAREVASKGQRVATFLVYLNDDYAGGETEFPLLDISYRGRGGDALLFWNVDESDEPDPRTRHTGTPPTSGEKWVLSQWVRRRPETRG